MCHKSYFSVKNLFSNTSRERCLVNFKNQPLIKLGNSSPSATAAVLVPMCCVDNSPSLLYTVRALDLRTNSGQISFPGGKSDDGETAIDTALRETKEEIGLCSSKIEIWGSGSTVPSQNNKMMITPIIGCINDLKDEDLTVNTKEVAELFSVSIEHLCDPQNQYYTQFRNGFILPVFVVNNYKIWGLTAYITHGFLSCLLPKDVYRNDWLKNKVIFKE